MNATTCTAIVILMLISWVVLFGAIQKDCVNNWSYPDKNPSIICLIATIPTTIFWPLWLSIKLQRDKQ